MICEQCKKEFDSDIPQDAPFICQDCKENVVKIKIEVPKKIDHNDILIKINDFLSKNEIIVPEREPCPQCHMTIADLISVGQFGCESCYDHYYPEFLAIAEKCQEGFQHVGKFPKPKKYIPETKDDEIKYVKLLKAKAVEMEDFQEAARLAEVLRNLMN
jgi:protein-arginine kinase activator protein McsA